ncbi:MAG: DUF58 domain-containing protein [Nanoarchaeota archaeon]|nr:DUF58 domain-containing protein [Nanoarchaeota archaeon]
MKKLLIDVTPVIQAFELTTKSALGGKLLGSYKSRFRGKGVEFEDYTEYSPGDDSNAIDWRASVRSNKVLIKEYTEERSINIFFLIDVSSSMVYTTGKKLKAEYAGELIISLAFLMIKNSDNVGIALFNDKIIKRYAPQRGLTQYYKIINTLLNSQNYGGGCDFSNALKFSFGFVRPKSLIIIVSDFIGMGSNWQDILKINAERFDIITFMVRDPADSVLPKTKREVILKDPFSNKTIRLSGKKVGEKYEKYVKQQEEDIKKFFTNLGISFLKLDTGESFAEPVIRFFNERKAILTRKGL